MLNLKNKIILLISLLILISISGCVNNIREGDDLDTNYMPNEEVYFYIDNTLLIPGNNEVTVNLVDYNNTIINTIKTNKSGRYVFVPRPIPGRYKIVTINAGLMGDVIEGVYINVW